jgi:hypothetical protein
MKHMCVVVDSPSGHEKARIQGVYALNARFCWSGCAFSRLFGAFLP